MKITIPKTINDCTPLQLSKWLLLVSNGVEWKNLMDRLEFRVQVVSIFSGVSKEELRTVAYQDINDMFMHCVKLLATYEVKEPNGFVNIGGRKYVFDKDIHNFNTGQVIDMKLIEDVYLNPSQVLAILYIEDGMSYNQIDNHRNIINPPDKRVKIFDQDFPGEEFMNVFGFFLTTYEAWKDALSVLNLIQVETMTNRMKKLMDKELKKMNGTTGQKRSVFFRRK